MRERAMPNDSNSDFAKLASPAPVSEEIAAAAGEDDARLRKAPRQIGHGVVMRSAAALSSTVLRAAETPGLIAPPSTTMPAGAPPRSCQGGKRSDNGNINASPSGPRPQSANKRDACREKTGRQTAEARQQQQKTEQTDQADGI